MLKESAELVLFLPMIPETHEKVHVYPCHDIQGYTYFWLFLTWFPSDYSILKENILKSYKNLKQMINLQQQKGIVFEIDLMIHVNNV